MPAPKFTFVGSEKKRDGANLLGGALAASLSTLTKMPEPEAPKPSQPTPSQINRQDAAMIRSGVTRPSVDQQRRDHFAQSHPEYTGGMEGARTRTANTAVVQAQAGVNDAQKKLDKAEQARAATATPTLPEGVSLADPRSMTGPVWQSYLATTQERTKADEAVKRAKGTLKDAEGALGHAQTQKADLDRERELLADVSAPRWDQLIRDKYADTDINGVVSETEVRSQKIKAKKGMVQAERDKVKGKMDAAQTIMFDEQNAAGDFWDPTRPTKRYAEAWRDYQAAKERVDELDVELNDLAKLDYPARNESAFGRLAADPEASASYASAQDVAADRDKVTAVVGYYQTGEGDLETVRQDLDHLSKKYGVTAGDFAAYATAQAGYERGPVMELYKKLDSRTEELDRDMDRAGYDLEDLYGYEQRLQKQKEAAKRAEETAKFAREHPVLSSVATVVASPLQAVDLLNMDWGKGKPGDVGYIPPDSSDMTLVNAIQTVRGTISQDLARNTDWELWGQNVPAFLYNTGMSMADSTLAISTFGTGSVYLMGLNSAVNTAKEVVDNGGTTDQALRLGIAAGVAEVLFEKMSVERLLKPKTAQGWRDVLKQYVVQQGLVELSEEALTETANILAEVSVLGQSSDYAKAVEGYRKAGDSEDQAKQKAFLDMAGRVGWAAGGGLLSGIGMGGGKAAMDYAGQVYNTGSDAVQLLPFNEHEKLNLSSGSKNKIVSGFDALVKFVRNALQDRTNIDRAYMGKLPDGVVSMVKEQTGVDISGFSAMINGDDIRHIIRDHGDPAKETAMGQIPVTAEDIAMIEQILAAPDDVTLSPKLDRKGRSVLEFSKNFGDRYITIQGISKGRHLLQTDTMYIRRRKDSQDTGHNATTGGPVNNAQSVPSQSPSINTIPQAALAVKAPTKTPAQLSHEAQVLSGLPLVENLGSFGRTGLTHLLESRGAVGNSAMARKLVDGYAELYLAGFARAPMSQDLLPADATPATRRLTAPERLQAYYNGLNDAQAMEHATKEQQPPESRGREEETSVSPNIEELTGGVADDILSEQGERKFRSEELFSEHYGKHKKEFGEISKSDYQRRANELADSPLSDDVVELTRSDGSIAKYRFSTNEFIVINADGTVRTFFKPKEGKEYWQNELDRN